MKCLLVACWPSVLVKFCLCEAAVYDYTMYAVKETGMLS